MTFNIDTVQTQVEAAGLTVRGAFHPGPDDAVPSMLDGTTPGTLVVLGNAGSSLWATFAASGFLDGRPDPLDDWSTAIVTDLAQAFDGRALFPFGGPPFQPFLRWAQKAEAVFPSPLGPLIHPEYGLWHAYRGALALSLTLDLEPLETRIARNVGQEAERHGRAMDDENRPQVLGAPCLTCVEEPCLTSCPAQAVARESYDVPRCIDYLVRHPDGPCMSYGCQARHACPVGTHFRYLPAQACHHMRVFVRNNRAPI